MSILNIKLILCFVLINILIPSEAKNIQNIKEVDNSIAVELCKKLYPIAYSAIINKNNGVTYKVMKEALPPIKKIKKIKNSMSKFVALNMHEIVDEVYMFETLDSNIYSTYRSEKCFYGYNGKYLKYRYKKIHSMLLNCQNGNLENYIDCAMKVVKDSLE